MIASQIGLEEHCRIPIPSKDIMLVNELPKPIGECLAAEEAGGS